MNSNHFVDLAAHHTFGLPAKAKSLRFITCDADIQSYLEQVQRGEETILLGEGSNTVFTRLTYSATVWVMALKGRQFLGEQADCFLFRVSAGENWHNWVDWSVRNGFPGLENLALIPGSVGACPVQNIGAYGLEVQDRLVAVHGFNLQTGKSMILSTADCEFAYRDSIFKGALAHKFLITQVDFSLPKQWQPIVHYGDLKEQCLALGGVEPLHVMQAVMQTRQNKLPNPKLLGNSGSFFKNPIVSIAFATQLKRAWPSLPVYRVDTQQSKLAAGWMIEACGLKGYQLGGVQVYPKQALVLTNCGQASGADVLNMVQHIQSVVQAQFGVMLSPEPILL